MIYFLAGFLLIGAKMNTENKQNEIKFDPIGIIHSPFKDTKDFPKQPYEGKGIKGTIEIYPEFIEGLNGLDKFSHIILIFNFHLSTGFDLQVVPYKEKHIRGVFATRSPYRPNQIGMSIIRLENINKNILNISNIDIIDGTPLLDIKPFVKEMDCFDIEDQDNSEWLNNKFKKE